MLLVVQLAIGLGIVLGPVVLFLACLWILAFIRTQRFDRKRGLQEAKVPYTDPVELYYSSLSLECQLVRCCLAEKGVECKVHEIHNGKLEEYVLLEKEYLERNPNADLPFLVHEGHVVLGWDDIIRYSEEKFEGTILMPHDPQEREAVVRWLQVATPSPGYYDLETLRKSATVGNCAQVLFLPIYFATFARSDRLSYVMRYVRAVLRHPYPMPEFGKLVRCIKRKFVSFPSVPQRPLVQMAFMGLNACLTELEKTLEDGRECVAGSFSLADIFLAGSLNRLELLGLLGVLLEDRRNTREYWSRLKRRKSFLKSFRPHPESQEARDVDRLITGFRKDVSERGAVEVYCLEGSPDAEEEEDN
jgi:glutathione S-transferase